MDDALGDGGTEEGHAFGEPGRHTSAVEGEIGGSGALHSSIFSQFTGGSFSGE
jgi:hypothetical protein